MEVEAKFKLKDGVLEKIEKIARFLEEKEEYDLYFSHPCRDFAKTDEALRLRVENRIKMTYKGPKVDNETKTREEVNLLIDSFENAVRLLEFLGFKKFKSIRKKRRIYELDRAIICVDKVEGLGDFLEIELRVPEEKERIFEIARILGYSREESIRLSYLELLERLNWKV
ncbi:MAG: class IV adenylate cyclase [Archaeoglobaceae archaeon]|nr:class IV adenylate cyclase [Archaeoglobaceae archaeon]MDW7989502.1 class IV adenylate cyclase [Archaeoglobaceae archaeon]